MDIPTGARLVLNPQFRMYDWLRYVSGVWTRTWIRQLFEVPRTSRWQKIARGVFRISN